MTEEDDDVSTDAVEGSTEKSPAHSQTLSRGIRALEILAAAPAPMTIAELSTALGVHRSVAYRILRTLEDHALLTRDDAGRVQAGPGLAALARGVSRDLQTAALPELTELHRHSVRHQRGCVGAPCARASVPAGSARRPHGRVCHEP